MYFGGLESDITNQAGLKTIIGDVAKCSFTTSPMKFWGVPKCNFTVFSVEFAYLLVRCYT